jgi:hypothetical protein
MLAILTTAEPWSLTSVCAKLIKIAAKVVSHGQLTFQLTDVAVHQPMFKEILNADRPTASPDCEHRRSQHERGLITMGCTSSWRSAP